MNGHKRKLETSESGPSRKKLKGRVSGLGRNKNREGRKGQGSSGTLTANDLPWKTVPNQGGSGEGDFGIMTLEEVDGVEVMYEAGNEGKIVGFQIKEAREMGDLGSEDVREPHATETRIPPFDAALLPSWVPYPLHAALLHSLHKREFEHPTPIQKRTLDVFLERGKSQQDLEEPRKDVSEYQRDIIGIAETGSGKTLAYGLPILHSIITSLSSTSDPTMITVKSPVATERRHLKALVLAPTRELALQVSEHLNACLDQLREAQFRTEVETVDSEGQDVMKPRVAPAVSVAAIVGGISLQKQRRIITRGVDILVATPGRLWELCSEDDILHSQLRSLRFLVLDEADRMVEAGHFKELESILRLMTRPQPEMDTVHAGTQAEMTQVEATPMDVETVQQIRNDTLQTFVFSATMSKELQRDIRRKGENRSNSKPKGSTLEDLLLKLDFRDPEPVIIDLSPTGGRVEGLQESKLECLANDKDAYLYYFLLRYPGRSLVFLSSVDGIRRLMPLLELLTFKAWPLHSGLQQKQRLKNLDRFKSTSNSILLATDVAARGLDVLAVDHVIHYQVPRSADAYLHRNGRTARAKHDGFALVLCAPDERRVLRGILTGLGRSDNDVPDLNVNLDILDKLKARVQLARKIDIAAHRVKKEMHDKNWMRDAAKAMGVELGSDFEEDGSEAPSKSFTSKSRDTKVAILKAELKQALSQPLVARGVSTRYLTSGSRAIVDDLVEGANHETMLGLEKKTPRSHVVKRKKSGQRSVKAPR